MKQHLKSLIALAVFLQSCMQKIDERHAQGATVDMLPSKTKTARADSMDYHLRHFLDVGDYTLRMETMLRCDSNFRYVPERNRMSYTGAGNRYFDSCDEEGAIQRFWFYHQDSLVGTMDNRTILNHLAPRIPRCCETWNAVVEVVYVLEGEKGDLYSMAAKTVGAFGLSALVDMRGSIQWYLLESDLPAITYGDLKEVENKYGITGLVPATERNHSSKVRINLYE